MNFNTVNNAIAIAVYAAGKFLKEFLKDKKIKDFELNRLLPIFIFVISEILNIAYGITNGENIVVSFSNGITSTFLAVYGYDIIKSLRGRENKL